MADVAETALAYIAFAGKVIKEPGFYVPPHLRDPVQIIRELLAENEQLRKAAIELRDDMIERAKRKPHLNSGEGFVEAGATVWANFCNVLAEGK